MTVAHTSSSLMALYVLYLAPDRLHFRQHPSIGPTLAHRPRKWQKSTSSLVLNMYTVPTTPQVVLIHGLSVPSIIWKDVAPQLAAKGFRVLLYGEWPRMIRPAPENPRRRTDLYGRGYSDAPHTTYDVNLYTTQLALLLQYVGWSKADIVGVSMVFTVPHPASEILSCIFSGRWHCHRVCCTIPPSRQ